MSVAQRRTAGPAIRPERSPDFAIPLRYLVAGLAGFVLFAAGVPLVAPELVLTNDDPRVFALVHLAILGWVVMVIQGALYQLFPVALQTDLKSTRLPHWNFWVYALGVGGFVPSFYFDWTLGVALFGSVAVGGLAHFAAIILRSAPSIRSWHPMAAYVLAAQGWLVATMGFGLVYALNWRFAWFEVSDPMLAAHAHLGLVGFLSLTLMGVSYKLTALFALAHGHDERVAYANLGLWNAGLLVLAAGLVFWPETAVASVGASLLGLGACVFVVDMGMLLRRRRRRAISLEQWHAFVSFASFLCAAALGLVMVTGHAPGRNWVNAYGWAAIAGWFGFAIAGKYYKIVPFLTWLHRYGHSAGAGPVPLLRDLVDDRLGWASLALLVAGFTTVLAGLLRASAEITRSGGLLYLAGSLVLAVNMALLITGRRAPERPARQGAEPARSPNR